ncbi:hypothetical protein BT63DRAFT_45628 [Microthyrium microscopicum]|uniref:SRCR domain-containing protein n=1 Tax=Microthyrium microscopicum TaxID=703497 RepID=A0A6A6U0Z1_9PEZI|nr:hypothetical protein BT63DRAFT_45628 [Microthyrium microscopicum]
MYEYERSKLHFSDTICPSGSIYGVYDPRRNMGGNSNSRETLFHGISASQIYLPARCKIRLHSGSFFGRLSISLVSEDLVFYWKPLYESLWLSRNDGIMPCR